MKLLLCLKYIASATQKHFEALKQKGTIRRMGPDQGVFWEVFSTPLKGTEGWDFHGPFLSFRFHKPFTTSVFCFIFNFF